LENLVLSNRGKYSEMFLILHFECFFLFQVLNSDLSKE